MGRIYKISQCSASVLLAAGLCYSYADQNQPGGYGHPPSDASGQNYTSPTQANPPGQNYSSPDNQPVTPNPGEPPVINSAQPPTTSAQAPASSAQPPAAPIGTEGGGDWPRVYVIGNTTNTVYQPQIESWDGYNLVARNAVAVQTADQPQPVYGVMHVKANTIVNKTERLVDIQNVRVVSADFPSAPDRQEEYLADLRLSFPQEFQNIPLDHLTAGLAVAQEQQKAATQPLDNTPPQIIFANRPSVLVYVDGAPAFRPVPGTDLSRVINTRVLLLKDNQSGNLYLHVLNGYLSAPALNGPWQIAAPPPGATVAENDARQSQHVDLLAGQSGSTTQSPPQLTPDSAPTVYVSTRPAELITFDGQPDYVPIPGTPLLWVNNTTADVFKSLADQNNYVLISGRWYRSPSLNGPWQFLPADQLPADFAQIPDSSPKENVKASIAGTPQAQEAVIENSIPQSTQVAVNTQIQPPQFDNQPQIAPITGTSLSYVVNSDTPIIEVNPQSWYSCQNGVWYTSGSVNGPWAVANYVPPVIYSIPPSSPLYYVTFVHIYSSTPQYVNEGYTPGYMGAMVAPDNTVVYGTGYNYQPWIGSVWFGPPVTWGFGCGLAWTPWFGWDFTFGLGWSWGFNDRDFWCHPPSPWWGPYGHWGRASWGRMPAWGPGGWARTGLNVYDRRFGRSSYSTFGINRWHGVYGAAYNSRTGELAAGQRASIGNVFNQRSRFASPSVGRNNFGTRNFGRNNFGVRENNAFATRNGGVIVRDGNASSGWRSVTPTRPFPQSSFSDLGRQNAAREMGQQRFNAFRNTYPAGGFHGEREFRGGSVGGARSPGGFEGGRGGGGGERGGGGRRR